MTCAKQTVTCTIVTPQQGHFVGTNFCNTPQLFCPRKIGEGYEKCKSICNQEGHAEMVALKQAGKLAKGSRAYIEGHDHACRDCQLALYAAGIISISVGVKPESD